MRVEYEPTYNDFKAAYHVYRRRRLSYVIWDFMFFKLVPLAAVVFLLINFIGERRGQFNPWFFNLASLPIAITATVFADRMVRLRHQRRNMFPAGARSRQVIVEVTVENIMTSIPGAIRTEYAWEAVSLFLCNRQVNLLYVSAERFIAIPNRILTMEEREFLQLTVAQKGIRRKSC